MNKTELIAAMSEVSGLTKKDAEAALNACTAVVTDALKAGDSVQLVGFGTFEEDVPRTHHEFSAGRPHRCGARDRGKVHSGNHRLNCRITE